ncbi:MAG: exodeoxyribonuclease VII large subunit, partial [Chloroflexi bacterium]|nr:exodeoxyribonuclease VII large subunit [Chloroflexota bacterium]
MSKQPTENRRSLAQVSRTLRSVIEAETLERYFWTSGIIQRYYLSDLGHGYFDLVDDNMRIRCMLHEERRGNIQFELENNLEVEVYGDVRFYERRSEMQIFVRDIRLNAAAIAKQPAIDRLRAAGLYPPRKRPPPQRIRRIGCISGRSSRAIGDFETAYQSAGERGVLAPLSWEYALLKGERAAQLITDAIYALDATADIDAIA